MCTRMCMATKTITIMEDAYEMLKAAKKKGESFSDVVRREIPKKRDLMDFAGSWSEEIADAFIELLP